MKLLCVIDRGRFRSSASRLVEVTLLRTALPPYRRLSMQIAAMKEADRLETERKAKERADFVKSHDTANGLTDAQAQERLLQYGPNVLDEKKRCVRPAAARDCMTRCCSVFGIDALRVQA